MRVNSNSYMFGIRFYFAASANTLKSAVSHIWLLHATGYITYVVIHVFYTVYDKKTVVDLFFVMNDCDGDAKTNVNAFIDYSWNKHLCDLLHS